MHFTNVKVRARLRDDRVNDGDKKSLITKIAEEWVMINTRGFQKDSSFQGIRLFCFSYGQHRLFKGI
ncbi:hypothetical protein SDC9_117490 [bioreactor metagenome]|uniref:Uncharacterized protein n=1 Tax=bioreactor metagenome TaxID=1076179 RepID=A0A645BZ56_9ZZZZ